MLNNSGESGHPCLVPDLRGTKVKIFPIVTQRDVMGREVGGGFMFGNACTPMVDSCQCMAKPIQYCK